MIEQNIFHDRTKYNLSFKEIYFISEYLQTSRKEVQRIMFQNSNEGIFFIGLNHKAAKFSHFSNLKTRLDSFNSWLKKIPTKESLAQAGFFYTEQRDIVICFFCISI